MSKALTLSYKQHDLVIYQMINGRHCCKASKNGKGFNLEDDSVERLIQLVKQRIDGGQS